MPARGGGEGEGEGEGEGGMGWDGAKSGPGDLNAGDIILLRCSIMHTVFYDKK